LLNKERAIVTSIAGTTRDAIEAGLYKNGNYWTLIDTAGLRQTDDIIEQQGIERSFAEAHHADVILLVVDISREMMHEEHAVYQKLITEYAHKIILVHHKIDMPHVEQEAFDFSGEILDVSSISKINILELEELIQQKIKKLFASIDSPFLLNQRQFNVMLELEKKLYEILPMLNNTIAYELLSCHLKDALESVSELTGKSVTELGMDKVFREFCVGK
jgi:tRNA modification GTPase